MPTAVVVFSPAAKRLLTAQDAAWARGEPDAAGALRLMGAAHALLSVTLEQLSDAGDQFSWDCFETGDALVHDATSLLTAVARRAPDAAVRAIASRCLDRLAAYDRECERWLCPTELAVELLQDAADELIILAGA